LVLRHRELVRQALRDERTLAELETQLQVLKLEQARAADPWELISTPTLLAQGPLAGAAQMGLPEAALPLCPEGVGAALCSHQLLITRAGAPDRPTLRRLRLQLRLQDRALTGWLLLPASPST
jgi:hypothetical protein